MLPPVLFLPGMMCDARLYSSQLSFFSNDHAVQVAPLNFAESMEELAAGVLATAPAKFALAGLSMGGIAAMEVLRQAPDRVLGLALLDTNPRAETDEVKALRVPQMENVKAGGLSQVMSEMMIPRYFHSPRPDLSQLCLEMAESLGADSFLKQSVALRDRPDQQETLKGCKVPTTIIMGESDVLCPRDRHELMHSLIPHASFEVLKDCGHLPTLEAPEATNELLKNWLKRI